MRRAKNTRSDSRDPGPMARLEARIADPETPEKIIRLCAAGYSLNQIARHWALPKGRFIAWIAGKVGLHLQCRRVWQLFGHGLLGEALRIVDAATPENFFAAQHQADLLLRRAHVYERMAKKRLRDYTDEELRAIIDEGRKSAARAAEHKTGFEHEAQE